MAAFSARLSFWRMLIVPLQQEPSMSRKHNRTSSSDHRAKKKSRRLPNWLWIVLGVVVLASLGILLFRPQNAPPVNASPSPTPASVEIAPAEAYGKFQQGAFFLDVRSQGEWDQVHIRGSVLIPLDQLPNRLAEVPQDREIVVVCLSGHRSQSGTAVLQQAGYQNVFCLSGGLTAWKDAGYPLEGNAP
jgi:rhodanese-related sulfurtransferase